MNNMHNTKISIIFITNGKHKNILSNCIKSAKFANEIIVVGVIDDIDDPSVIKIDQKELALTGQISKLRNIGADNSNGNIIINADDDIFFPPSFKNKLLKYINLHKSFDAFTTKVLLKNGSRYWDRPIHVDDKSTMIEYDETHPDLYYSGAFIIRSKEFASKYKWDDNLKYYQKEDVHYSNMIKTHGYSINIDKTNYVIHLDDSYSAYRNDENKLICDKTNHEPTDVQEKEYREINKLLKEVLNDI